MNKINYQKEILKSLQFEVHLVEHCNLNCQMCDHFSPLAQKNFLEPANFERDCSKLAMLFNKKATYVRLLGGEPLLHPLITKFFSIARQHFPSAPIQLFSNGLLFKRQSEEFWESAKKYNICIYVTKYPVQYNYTEVKNLAISKGVQFQFTNREPLKTSWKLPLNPNGTLNNVKNYMDCNMGNECIFLKNGILYPCTVPPNIEHFNLYFNKNIRLSPSDGINIHNVKNGEEILNFLRNPIPFCKYCSVSARTYNHKWRRSQKSIDEWT